MDKQTTDLTVLGKMVGGGMPVGAYGGRADVMTKSCRPAQCSKQERFQATRGDGGRHRHSNRATPSSSYTRLDELGAQLEKGLRQAAEDAGVPHCLNRFGSMWTLFFTEGPVTNYNMPSEVIQINSHGFFGL